jgi:hypothetical protein
MNEDIDYKKLYEDEKHKNDLLKKKIDDFSLPSKSKLFYSLNRHQNNWADTLNGIDLSLINVDDPKDKTVERLKIIYALIGANAPIVDALRLSAGITGDEDKDMASRKPFVDTIADNRD